MPKLERCPTCHRKHKRSLPQNAFYWLLLHAAEKQLRPRGESFAAESYHLMFRSKYLGCDDVPMPNGKTMTIPRSTTDCDVAEFAEYFTKVEAELAEHGVFLDGLERG